MAQLKELSEMVVKVINCSWATLHLIKLLKMPIDEMFENGTIIVAAAGNQDWEKK